MSTERQWFCLDVNFFLDEKLDTLTDEQGEAMGYRYLKLVALVLTHGSGGWLRPAKRMQWAAVRKQMGYTREACGDGAGDEFKAFLGILAEYELIDPDVWREQGYVTSRRMTVECDRMDGRKARAEAGAAARHGKAPSA